MQVLAVVCMQVLVAVCTQDLVAACTQVLVVVCTRDQEAAHTPDLAVAFTSVQGLRMDITGPGARASPVYSVPRGDSRIALVSSPDIRARDE